MPYLLDTNILLRWQRPSDAHHAAARNAIEVLTEAGETLFVAPQSLSEFWNVATRPVTKNGYGLSAAQVELQIQRIESAFQIAPESPAIYSQWRRLVASYGVIGLEVFDTRLVAVMQTHGIQNILTFNGADFQRFAVGEGITIVDPVNVPTPTL